MLNVGLVDEDGLDGVAELGWVAAGFEEDGNGAVGAEVSGAECEVAAAVLEGDALVVETEADFEVGGEVLADDGEADDS
jgi:hypothetical protein